jgi:hypothetical protein
MSNENVCIKKCSPQYTKLRGTVAGSHLNTASSPHSASRTTTIDLIEVGLLTGLIYDDSIFTHNFSY